MVRTTEEDNISKRQLTRMIYVEGFGAASLTYPAVAARYGWLSLPVYGFFLILFVFYLLWMAEGRPLPTWAAVIYVLRFFVNITAVFYFFGVSIREIYTPDHNLWWLFLPFAVLLWYCTGCPGTNIQKHARFQELIFPWIAFLFSVMVITVSVGIFTRLQAVVGESGPGSLTGVLQRAGISFSGGWEDAKAEAGSSFVSILGTPKAMGLLNNALTGGYLLLLCSSPLEFIYLLVPCCVTCKEESPSCVTWKEECPSSVTCKEECPSSVTWKEECPSSMTWKEEPPSSVTCKEECPSCMTWKEKPLSFGKGREGSEKQTRKQSRSGNLAISVLKGTGGGFLCNLLLCFVTISTLGITLTAKTPWPVIKIMQLIHLPGGFLERFDILLAVYWILCVIGVLSAYLFYGRKLIEERISAKGSEKTDDDEKGFPGKNTEKEGKNAVDIIPVGTGLAVLLIYLISCLVPAPDKLLTGFLWYKKWIDLPLILLVPLLIKMAGFIGKRKKKVFYGMLMICLILIMPLGMTGCSKQSDIEKKRYITSIYVDVSDKHYDYYVADADLSEMEEKDSHIPSRVQKISGDGLKVIEGEFRASEVGHPEWNHIETIFIGPGLRNSPDMLIGFLEEWEDSWQKSPSVTVCLCDRPAEETGSVEDRPAEETGSVENRPAEETGSTKDILSGQEIKDLIDQIEQPGKVCRTPIDILKRYYEGEKNILIYGIETREEGQGRKATVLTLYQPGTLHKEDP